MPNISSGGNPVLELETLLVRIMADATQYTRTMRAVETNMVKVQSMFNSVSGLSSNIGRELGASAQSIQLLTSHLRGLARHLNTVTDALAGTSFIRVKPHMDMLADGFRNVSAGASGLGKATAMLRALNAVETTNILRLVKILSGDPVSGGNLAKSLTGMAAVLTNSSMHDLLDMAPRFRALADIGNALASFTPALAASENFKSLEHIGLNVRTFAERLGSSKYFLRLPEIAANAANLGKIGVHLARFGRLTAAIDFANLADMAKGLRTFARITTSVHFTKMAQGAANFKALEELGRNVALFAKHLEGINVTKLMAAAHALRAAVAASGAGLMGPRGGSRGGPLIPSGAMHNFGFAAGRPESFAFQFQLLRYGAIGAGIMSTISFARYDDALTRSMALTRNATTQMRNDLEDLIDRMVLSDRVVADSATLARTFGNLTQAGVQADQAMRAMEPIQQLSLIAGMPTDEIGEDLLSIAHNFDELTASMESFVRIGNMTVRASQMVRGTTEEHLQALARFAPFARGAGISVTDSMSIVMAMAQAGMVGQEGGTAATRLIDTMRRGSVRYADVWRRYGLSMFDPTTGQQLPIANVAGQFQRLMGGMSEQQQAQILMQLGIGQSGSGTNLQRAISALMNIGPEGLQRFSREMNNVEGVMEEVYSKHLTAFSKQMQILWTQTKHAGTVIGEVLAPTLKLLAGTLQLVLKLIIGIPQWLRGLLGTLLAVWASTKLLVLALTSLRILVGVKGMVYGLTLALTGANVKMVSLSGSTMLFYRSIGLLMGRVALLMIAFEVLSRVTTGVSIFGDNRNFDTSRMSPLARWLHTPLGGGPMRSPFGRELGTNRTLPRWDEAGGTVNREAVSRLVRLRQEIADLQARISGPLAQPNSFWQWFITTPINAADQRRRLQAQVGRLQGQLGLAQLDAAGFPSFANLMGRFHPGLPLHGPIAPNLFRQRQSLLNTYEESRRQAFAFLRTGARPTIDNEFLRAMLAQRIQPETLAAAAGGRLRSEGTFQQISYKRLAPGVPRIPGITATPGSVLGRFAMEGEGGLAITTPRPGGVEVNAPAVERTLEEILDALEHQNTDAVDGD